MISARPLLFVLVISFLTGSAFAAGDGSDPQTSEASVQNQTAGSALFGQPYQSAASELFFMKDRPRLNFTAPTERPRSAVLNNTDCYTMRMYKVKRKERFGDGESGLKGYTTCELASNYQMRSAVAHVQTIESNDVRSRDPQK